MRSIDSFGLLLLLITALISAASCCTVVEREALLDAKRAHVENPPGNLSAWTGRDCCKWPGVGCDPRRAVVTELDLHSDDFLNLPVLNNIAWISRLSSLQVLNLENVQLQLQDAPAGVQLLLELNKIPSISELHLSNCNLTSIPMSIPRMNFTSLTHLDLSTNSITSASIPSWLFNIATLEHLDLHSNALHGAIPDEFGDKVALKFLCLTDNSFDRGSIPLSMSKLCKLQELGLSYSNITGDIGALEGVFSGCMKESLEVLGLGGNKLTGYLPKWLGELKNIRVLDLSSNSLTGTIPESIGRLSSLENLRLADNQLHSTIPESLGQLSNLTKLRLNDNKLHGVLSESHFLHLGKLTYLDLSTNSLALNVSSQWVPPFRLEFILLSSCGLGPRFPSWLRLQDKVQILDISSAGISDNIPEWYWNNTTDIYSIDLSNNSIHGELPMNWNRINFTYVNLRSNRIEGPLPAFTSSIQVLLLSENSLSGTIMPEIGEIMPNLEVLVLSANKLNGGIPITICKLQLLSILDLANNNLSMHIPSCWQNSSKLNIFDISGNRLAGEIPIEVGFLLSLEGFHLNRNELYGPFPSIDGLTKLKVLDLGDNMLSGNIPTSVMKGLSSLKVLRLRSNMFSGEIPVELFLLSSLQVIDIANNSFVGAPPQRFSNISSMKVLHLQNESMSPSQNFYYEETVVIIKKGQLMTYTRILRLVVSIDLSVNNFSGPIPADIGELFRLQTLNLSNNHLTGRIPATIGQLKWLESLDLSMNNLSGEIPLSMGGLTFLSHLNLSYNNLSGRIPRGNQFVTFIYPSIYTGNRGLCGFPLEECHEEVELEGKYSAKHSESVWIYISTTIGFLCGFWSVCGALMVKKNWRDAYFRFVDRSFEETFSRLAVNQRR